MLLQQLEGQHYYAEVDNIGAIQGPPQAKRMFFWNDVSRILGSHL